MSKSLRSINIFISHPFEPDNPAYDLEKFRTNVKLLISRAENLVRKEYQDFDVQTTFVFSDLFEGLPQQVEEQIRRSHLAIVDITENKPNIFFEYGFFRGLSIPVLLIKAQSSIPTFPIPADIKNQLVQVYENFDKLLEKAESPLADFFKKLINSDSLYNVYLNKIWFPDDVGTVHIVTSTEFDKREAFAAPESDNYMLLESLGDKDSLLFIVAFLNRTYRGINLPMYAADAFPGAHVEQDCVIIGGPGAEDGDDNPICKTMMDRLKVKVAYSDDCEKMIFNAREYTATKKGNKTVRDYGYFARSPNPLNPKSSVILVNGIHTFGVLGAAKVFSDHPSAQGNIRAVLNKLKLDDIKKACFECFFPVDVVQHSVIVPTITEDDVYPL